MLNVASLLEMPNRVANTHALPTKRSRLKRMGDRSTSLPLRGGVRETGVDTSICGAICKQINCTSQNSLLCGKFFLPINENTKACRSSPKIPVLGLCIITTREIYICTEIFREPVEAVGEEDKVNLQSDESVDDAGGWC